MFDALRQRWRAYRSGPQLPDASPSTLEAPLSDMGSTLSESEFGQGAVLSRPASGGFSPSLPGAPSLSPSSKPSAAAEREPRDGSLYGLATATVLFALVGVAAVFYGGRSGDAATWLAASSTEIAAQAEKLESDAATQGERFKALQRGLGLATDPPSVAALSDAAQALRDSQTLLLKDSQALRQRLQSLQADGVKAGTSASGAVWLQAACGVLVVLCTLALVVQQRGAARRRREVEEQARAQAQAQEKDIKRVNDATQAAILRLMNELQLVAEGDLTQQATVTEDITGAIADSINYTVEELRTLVGQVQGAAQRVGDTTAQVENTSIELLAASTEQLREIRETGQAVLDMAGRINLVSSQAEASVDVARQALKAAESGAQAVQNAIGGMNTIREQIQDTAKRIKRLGESSQEIGEITELISDITEQTNVLALNAAIQAASAGEAGRGFSVVAEEVQRLAERSADATRQIAALVRAIQADTQDAVLAMERSTREVVEGARLSDNAGTALADIDRLSRQAAELIEQIAISALRESELASQTGANIQHIFAVTEQTGEGTRSTVQQVRELARVADELRQSVARFKIG